MFEEPFFGKLTLIVHIWTLSGNNFNSSFRIKTIFYWQDSCGELQKVKIMEKDILGEIKMDSWIIISNNPRLQNKCRSASQIKSYNGGRITTRTTISSMKIFSIGQSHQSNGVLCSNKIVNSASKDSTFPAKPMEFTCLLITVGPILPTTSSWPTLKFPMKNITISMIWDPSSITMRPRNILIWKLSKLSVILERSLLLGLHLWIVSCWPQRVTIIWFIYGLQTSINWGRSTILPVRLIWSSWPQSQKDTTMLLGSPLLSPKSYLLLPINWNFST